jgi:BirA family biotin operon repressor/biotin-[acetyl-CoA-carboxylase] ligase
MCEQDLRNTLSGLPFSHLRFLEQTSSTNDVALAWAADNAPDLSLVYAEEQTSGRGRGSRRWFSPPGASLAFSLIVRPTPEEELSLRLFSGLGAIAVCIAVEKLELKPEIKWPNDLLLNQRKFCGILAEAVWMQERAESVVLGIGVNITPTSIPPKEGLNFPATCLEDEAGRSLDRLSLLRKILAALLTWRPLLASEPFIQKWDKHLAYRGQMVEVRGEVGEGTLGEVDGVDPDGSLRLRAPNGTYGRVHSGEVHLRPVV